MSKARLSYQERILTVDDKSRLFPGCWKCELDAENRSKMCRVLEMGSRRNASQGVKSAYRAPKISKKCRDRSRLSPACQISVLSSTNVQRFKNGDQFAQLSKISWVQVSFSPCCHAAVTLIGYKGSPVPGPSARPDSWVDVMLTWPDSNLWLPLYLLLQVLHIEHLCRLSVFYSFHLSLCRHEFTYQSSLFHPSVFFFVSGSSFIQQSSSMSELKLRRLLEHNQRLREDLNRPRLRVSEASAA